MTERAGMRYSVEAQKFLPILSEIERPSSEVLELYWRKNAVLIDNKFILAYMGLMPSRVHHEIWVGRERTMPIKIERSADDVLYDNPNAETLRGSYGVLWVGLRKDRPTFYVTEQYKVSLQDSFHKGRRSHISLSLSSTCPLETQDLGTVDFNFNQYLSKLHIELGLFDPNRKY